MVIYGTVTLQHCSTAETVDYKDDCTITTTSRKEVRKKGLQVIASIFFIEGTIYGLRADVLRCSIIRLSLANRLCACLPFPLAFVFFHYHYHLLFLLLVTDRKFAIPWLTIRTQIGITSTHSHSLTHISFACLFNLAALSVEVDKVMSLLICCLHSLSPALLP